jgi:phage-related baseplate assembly protein
MAQAPIFIDILDPDQIFADMSADFVNQAIASSGNANYTLEPGDPCYALLKEAAYREYLIRQQIQSAGVSGLVDFSSPPILDYLGRNRNVTRLQASAAKCTIRFTPVIGHGAFIIPAGTLVSTTDGKYVFATDADTSVQTSDMYVDAVCTCTDTGSAANGYAIGIVSQIQTPVAYISTASNIDMTSGGSEIESDAALRQRIILANATYSVAGSADAYKYWSRTASPAIIDVSAISPYPGEADIYVLTNSLQTTTQPILDVVNTILNANTVRPMCDLVNVYSANQLTYSLTIGLTLYKGSISGPVITAVTNALTAYTASLSTSIGLDVIGDQIRRIILNSAISDIYECDLGGFSDIVVDNTSFAVCTGTTVTVTGTKDK